MDKESQRKLLIERRTQVLVVDEVDWLCIPASLTDDCVVVGYDQLKARVFIIPATDELYFILCLQGARPRTDGDILI